MTPIIPSLNAQFGCIYLIKNRQNNKIYVGQAHNFYKRVVGHKKCKHGLLLKRAIKEFGFKSFDFFILEQAPDNLSFDDLKKWLSEKEQLYLDSLNPFGENGYNQCRISGSSLGYKHREESKKIIKEKRAIQTQNGWVSPTLGTTRPESVKKAVSKANTGKVTQRREVNQIDANTNELIKQWNSMKEASKALNIPVTRICSVARQRPKWSSQNKRWYVDHTAGGFKWTYASELITGRWDRTDMVVSSNS